MRRLPYVAFFLLAFSVFPAGATSFSFLGSFTNDDDLRYFHVAVASDSTVIFRTLSYGGGPNQASNVITAGGFDPILSVFQGFSDPNGLMLGTNNDGPCPPGNPDPLTNACWDSYLSISLTAGSYTLVLSQADNSALGPFLSDGFLRTGQGNFTGPAFLGSPGSFIDQNGVQRSNSWAVDILDVQDAVIVPEPTPALFLLSGIAALALIKRISAR